MAHRHLRHVQRLCDATLEPALPLQTQCLETTPLPPILQRAFRGFHAYLMPISKIKLHCATISKRLMLPMTSSPSPPIILASRKNHSDASCTPACCERIEIGLPLNGRSPLKVAHANMCFSTISR